MTEKKITLELKNTISHNEGTEEYENTVEGTLEELEEGKRFTYKEIVQSENGEEESDVELLVLPKEIQLKRVSSTTVVFDFAEGYTTRGQMFHQGMEFTVDVVTRKVIVENDGLELYYELNQGGNLLGHYMFQLRYAED
jgi:uncharacterized beta-barrel protein YwiB (DUF1934 family)